MTSNKLDIAFMLERRDHWTKHEPGDREYDERSD